MRIWCVEDDSSIRDIEVYALNSTGYEARGFNDGEAFFEALEEERPDLVILDIMLPGQDGLAILKQLRQTAENSELPVIMATAKGMEHDTIMALDAGADDYLVKPFGIMEMIARVRAVLRRCQNVPSARLLKLRNLELNPENRQVLLDKEQLNLTFKEFELLKLFLQHPGKVFTREQLFKLVWGNEYMGESRTVDMHIRTLRQKLQDLGAFIKTVRSVGYVLEEEE